jgi:hypothetical protein
MTVNGNIECRAANSGFQNGAHALTINRINMTGIIYGQSGITLSDAIIAEDINVAGTQASGAAFNIILDRVTVLNSNNATNNIAFSGVGTNVKISRSRFRGLVNFTGTTIASAVIRHTEFNKITALPPSSILANTVCYDTAASSPVINGIGANCQLYNCSILGGSLAIDNGSPVSVKFTTGSSAAQAAMGANITLT